LFFFPAHTIPPSEFREPLIETQHEIVADIETERALVAANHDLIARMEKKIQSALSRVWGETQQNEAI